MEEKIKCCICDKEIKICHSNNPDPIGTLEGRCCDDCNSDYVLPCRMCRTILENYKKTKTVPEINMNISCKGIKDKNENLINDCKQCIENGKDKNLLYRALHYKE